MTQERTASAGVATVSAAVVATVLTGCTQASPPAQAAKPSAAAATNGPVRIGNNPGRNCLPPSTTGELTMGFDVVRSTASAPVTVTDVELQGSSGVRVTGSYLMPLRHMNLIGVVNTWPPTTAAETNGDWQQRVPAVGVDRLKQAHGVRDWNLVLRLRTDPAVSAPRYQRVLMRYTTGGKRYLAGNGTGLVVKPRC